MDDMFAFPSCWLGPVSRARITLDRNAA